MQTRRTDSNGAPSKRISLAGVATVSMSWRYGGVDALPSRYGRKKTIVTEMISYCAGTTKLGEK